MVARLAGSIVASAVLLFVASETGHFDPVASGFASNGCGDRSPGRYSLGAAFIIEVLMTAMLVLTILGATDVKAPVEFAGIAIGFVLTLIHSIPVTNTSVNPVRNIGPALFAGSGAIGQLWLFIPAPLVGAATASGLYSILQAVDPVIQIPASQAHAALSGQQDAKIEVAKTLTDVGRQPP